MKKNVERVVVQGNRRYQGNPIKYFKDHEKRYLGLNRYELLQVDPGLHKSLMRAGQMDKAIPERYGGRHSFSEKKINNLIAAYEIHKGKAYRAAKKFHCSCSTVTKYWILGGKEVRRVGRPEGS